jgi:hypothetical protein
MSEFKGKIAVGVSIAIIGAAGLALGLAALYPNSLQGTTPTTSSSTSTVDCGFSYIVQPLGTYVRFLSDSTGDPVSGALVEVVETVAPPPSCGSTSGSTKISVTYTFNTNSDVWYSLVYHDGVQDQLTIDYESHVYNITMPLAPFVYTCETIFIPSSLTNVTTSSKAPCASASTGSTSSSTSTTNSNITGGLERSGPISTYPAKWALYSSCPGYGTQGDTTTISNLANVTYPDSWNTTTVVSLTQVYQAITRSSAFINDSSGEGWVVYSWNFIQGGSTNIPPNGDDIVGYFIFTNATGPAGYVTAYYDIQNSLVSLSTPETTVTVNCPSFAASSTLIASTSATSG